MIISIWLKDEQEEEPELKAKNYKIENNLLIITLKNGEVIYPTINIKRIIIEKK